MKTIYAKICSWKESECLSDVGEIISMSDCDVDDYSGFASLETTAQKFAIKGKINFVLCSGCTIIETEKEESLFCSDPRVIMLYLWRVRQHLFREPETDPPIPTREEAIAWLKKMDIPLEPQESPREWTRKLKRNFLNIKD